MVGSCERKGVKTARCQILTVTNVFRRSACQCCRVQLEIVEIEKRQPERLQETRPDPLFLISWLTKLTKTVTDSPTEIPDVERGLRQFIEQGRIDAEIKTVPIWESGVFDTISMNSRDADFVFIGLRPPDIQDTAETYGVYIRDIMQQTQKIPLAAYVLSSEDMEFRKLFSSLEAS